ncbi:hypothetical protein C8Q74DRAFT_270477 [Fomes fomentarius]|nr:hypothetical protein C8Q74DRAFT_270477 [Fomes fomentarius]
MRGTLNRCHPPWQTPSLPPFSSLLRMPLGDAQEQQEICESYTTLPRTRPPSARYPIVVSGLYVRGCQTVVLPGRWASTIQRLATTGLSREKVLTRTRLRSGRHHADAIRFGQSYQTRAPNMSSCGQPLFRYGMRLRTRLYDIARTGLSGCVRGRELTCSQGSQGTRCTVYALPACLLIHPSISRAQSSQNLPKRHAPSTLGIFEPPAAFTFTFTFAQTRENRCY